MSPSWGWRYPPLDPALPALVGGGAAGEPPAMLPAPAGLLVLAEVAPAPGLVLLELVGPLPLELVGPFPYGFII
jgi:hypothetical protein